MDKTETGLSRTGADPFFEPIALTSSCMKPLIVYQSRTENTEILVDAMAPILNADLMTVDRVRPGHFKGRTLIGFGSGIYYARVDRKIYEAAAFVPGNCNVFMFITSSLDRSFILRFYWHCIQKSFDRLGVGLVGRWNCRGYEKHPLTRWIGISKGHPDTADIESAKQFAMRMRAYD